MTTRPIATIEALAQCCVPIAATDMDAMTPPRRRRCSRRSATPPRARGQPAGDGPRGGASVTSPTSRGCVAAHGEPSHAQVVEAGLLAREQRGVWAYYSLRSDAIRRLGEVSGSEASEEEGESIVNELEDEVRERYAAAVKVVATGRAADDNGADMMSCCDGCLPEDGIGVVLYDPATRADVPDEAVLASPGCGNPTVVADLARGRDGARPRLRWRHRRAAVGQAGGPNGHGLRARHDRRDARPRARERPEGRRDNVEFLKGYIEDDPAPGRQRRRHHLQLRDQPLRQTSRACSARRSGSCGLAAAWASGATSSDDRLTPDERTERGSYVGRIAGALRSWSTGPARQAGFVDV